MSSYYLKRFRGRAPLCPLQTPCSLTIATNVAFSPACCGERGYVNPQKFSATSPYSLKAFLYVRLALTTVLLRGNRELVVIRPR